MSHVSNFIEHLRAALREDAAAELGPIAEKAAGEAERDVQEAEQELVRWIAGRRECGCAEQLYAIRGQLDDINEKVETIMSEDAAIQAVVSDVQADVAAITANVATIQAALTAALADEVQPSTVTALQSAQAALDSLSATVASDASSDAPPASTPPAAPAS